MVVREALSETTTTLEEMSTNQKQYGRPCTKVGGRPCVALRTPGQLCNCRGPAKTEARATAQSIGQLIGGERIHPRRLCSSRQRRVLHDGSRLVTDWFFGAVTAQPVENRLARPIRSPPSSRRACVARWSQVIHRYPPLLRKLCGGTRRQPRVLSGPPDRVNEWAVDFYLRPLEKRVNGKNSFPLH